MAQTRSTMRLFVSEFLLMVTSDRINLQNQSIKRALNGILDFSHPILPPKSVSHCLILFVSTHDISGHPNVQGCNLEVTVGSSFSWVATHTLSASHISSLHFLGPVWSLWPLLLPRLLQQPLHFGSWILQSILCKTTRTIFAKGELVTVGVCS